MSEYLSNGALDEPFSFLLVFPEILNETFFLLPILTLILP